jgi:hypothetical protein
MLGCQPKCRPDAHLQAGNTALTFQHANQLLVYQAVIYALSPVESSRPNPEIHSPIRERDHYHFSQKKCPINLSTNDGS